MTATMSPVGVLSAELATLSEAAREYVAASQPSSLSTPELLAELTGRERLRRSLLAADHALITELVRRGVATDLGSRSTGALLQDTLRLSSGEANARVRAAASLGPRMAITGTPMPALLPATAAADAAGDLSPGHIAAILGAVAELPPNLSTADIACSEAILTQVALNSAPAHVHTAGQRLIDTLNPDNAEPLDPTPTRRAAHLHQRRDGWYELTARLSPECGATAHAVLSAYSAPAPNTDAGDGKQGIAVSDERTPDQRTHDALQDLFNLALRADTLSITGRRAQLIITATHRGPTEPALETGEPGTPAVGPLRLGRSAYTSFGDRISARTALALCDTAMVSTTTQTAAGAVLNYEQTRRFASKTQLRALTARDGGCTFPGCDQPPEWCDAHHIAAWADGGPTNLTNLTLLCGYHHRSFQRTGWTCHIPHGYPQWTPPPHIDPDQRPQRNNRHRIRHLLPG